MECTSATTESTLTKESVLSMINSIPVIKSSAVPSETREPRPNDWVKKHIKDKGLLGKIFYKSKPSLKALPTFSPKTRYVLLTISKAIISILSTSILPFSSK